MTETATSVTTEDSVTVAVEVSAPVERAFGVFTEGFGSWWPPSHSLSESGLDVAILEPVVGGRWYERGADGSECDWGRVLVWDPPRHVAMSWNLDRNWKAGVPDHMASRVDVRFEPLPSGGTRVELVHSGFSNQGPGWETIRDAVGAGNGWSGLMQLYGEHVLT